MHAERAARRCPSCGSRLEAGAPQCRICGAEVPWRLTVPGVLLESLAAVAVIALVVAGLAWLERSGGPIVSPAARIARLEVIGAPPTEPPTFTPAPPPTGTRPPNTPRPPTATPLPETITYTVKGGDTLFGIAAELGVTADTILAANADTLESANKLSIGQELRIPVRAAEAPPPAEAEAPVAAAPPSGDAPADAVPTDEAAAQGSPEPSLAAGVAVAPSAAVTSTVAAREPTGAPSGLSQLEAGDKAAVALDASEGATYPAVRPLAPTGGVTVTAGVPLLRWSSAGVLPDGVFYVVALRDSEAGSAATPELLWITSNATAVRVPARYRPALGVARRISWSVSVRRRAERLFGGDEGMLLSPTPAWQTFLWAP